MKAKAIIFWLLMVGSAVGLWWSVRTAPGQFSWRESLWIAAVVVPSGVLISWFRGRFSGRKRRMANIAIYSFEGIVLTAAIAAWKFVLVSAGYESQRNLLEGAIASVISVGCCSVLIWSVLRLRKLPS